MTGYLKMRSRKSLLGPVGVCVGLFLAGAWASGCQKSSAGDTPSEPVIPVDVQIATAVKIPDTTEYLSILKSRHSAAINPQVEGQITRIFVKSGDNVHAGTPLLQIDPLKQEATVSSQEASRAAQEANVRYAKVSLDRANCMTRGSSASRNWTMRKPAMMPPWPSFRRLTSK